MILCFLSDTYDEVIYLANAKHLTDNRHSEERLLHYPLLSASIELVLSFDNHSLAYFSIALLP